jgi:hypothetical protein
MAGSNFEPFVKNRGKSGLPLSPPKTARLNQPSPGPAQGPAPRILGRGYHTNLLIKALRSF